MLLRDRGLRVSANEIKSGRNCIPKKCCNQRDTNTLLFKSIPKGEVSGVSFIFASLALFTVLQQEEFS